MMESTRSRKVGACAAFVVSWMAVYWLASLMPLKGDILFRIGFMAAVLCALGGLTFFWGVLLSYIGRWRKWSPRSCHFAGGSLLLPLAILYVLIPQGHFLVVFNWSATLWVPAGYICGKLAHPELTDDEAYAPEPPLTLFPK
jgi:hypothetical protein